ncbi:hypothetical protein [Verrucomicrobium spinosum]|uniref:hypothetical protein n=1 Tax=Verrucomicrobium spinosum TaxID=2736 RepID=UPI0009464BD2|nr:hypothetical protein [Verrucomicrobium spinosum]
MIPAVGENTLQTVFVKGQPNGSPYEASRMVVTLAGDGAISELVYKDVHPVREFSINHRYLEESAPGTPHQIKVTVEDDDGGVASVSAGEIEVTNGPPIIESLVTIPVTADLNTVTVISKFVDSSEDIHTARVEFGDGTVVDAIVLQFDKTTGRFIEPTYPGTTEPVKFIDPTTGELVPLVNPVTGQAEIARLVNPLTGSMARLYDPATGGSTGSYAILDASARQIYATHHYAAESTFTIKVSITDEEGATGTDETRYSSFRPTSGSREHIRPVDVVQSLTRLGFDISGLVGGSGIFGDRYGAGIFGGFSFSSDRDGLALFVGRTSPGGIVVVSLYNELGYLVGVEELIATWMATG